MSVPLPYPDLTRSERTERAMWHIASIEAVEVELDFTSSGRGRYPATAIDVDGIRICNAIEWVDVESDATQVEVCECCGFSQCAPGGWVAFRRIGDRVVWIPAWGAMAKGNWEASEFGPPAYLRKRGAPIFSAAIWEELRSLHSDLPACADLPGIDSREAARMWQLSAPGRELGEYPLEPRLRRDRLDTVTAGDLAAVADRVDACLRAHFEVVRTMVFVPDCAAVRPIEFWCELPGTPNWTAFAHVADNVCFLLDDGTALIHEGALRDVR